MTILWILIGLFGLMSIVFLLGKGSFLISGYNTASEAEKAMYDEKKLCRVMGIGTSIMTLSLLISVLFEESGIYVILPGIIIGILIIFVGSRTYAKKSDYEWIDTKKKDPIKWYKNSKFYTSIFTTVILIGVGIMLFTGEVKIELNNDSLTANAFLTSSQTVDFDDIEKVEYKKDINLGSRTWGVGSFKVSAGNFKNDIYGSYKLYANANCHSYVVLSTSDGYVVINEKTEEKTLELFEKVQQAIQKK
ncbi:MAG: DUF3784 domain-containing protein [Coprobacillus sp.]